MTQSVCPLNSSPLTFTGQRSSSCLSLSFFSFSASFSSSQSRLGTGIRCEAGLDPPRSHQPAHTHSHKPDGGLKQICRGYYMTASTLEDSEQPPALFLTPFSSPYSSQCVLQDCACVCESVCMGRMFKTVAPESPCTQSELTNGNCPTGTNCITTYRCQDTNTPFCCFIR